MFLIALLLVSEAFATSSALAPDVEDFFTRERMSEPVLSPNGQYVCIADRRKIKAQRLLVINLNDMENPYALPVGKRILGQCAWATDSKLLISLSVTDTVNMRRHKGKRNRFKLNGDIRRRIWISMNRDGSESKILTSKEDSNTNFYGNSAGLIATLPKEPDTVLMSAYDGRYNLYRVNILSGEWKLYERGTKKTTGYKLDGSGLPIVRYERVHNGRSFRLTIRAPGETTWSELVTLREDDLKNFSPISDTDKVGEMYVSARPEGYDKAAIFKYDLKSGEYTETVSSNDKVDLHSVLTDTLGAYVGTVYYDDRLKYDFLDRDLQKYINGANGFFDGEMDISITDVSENGNRWILFADSPRHPGSYYAYDLKNKRIDKIFDKMVTIAPEQLGKTDWIDYTARDGTKLNAYVTHPPKVSAMSTAPLIVMPHGGPESRDIYGFDPMTQFLVSRGYRVLQPMFRGSSGYGEAFTEAGYGEWGGLMQDDITDSVMHLIDKGIAQPGDICIAGASFGGYAALMGAVKTPDLYACAISIAGISDLRVMVKHERYSQQNVDDPYGYAVRSLGDPKKDKQKMIERSPALQTDKVKIPILLIHGEKDVIVPIKQSEIFNKAMRKSGKSIKFVEYENMYHSLLGYTDEMLETPDLLDNDRHVFFKELLLEMETFLDENLD